MKVDVKTLNKLKRFCIETIPTGSALTNVCNHPATPHSMGYHEDTGEMILVPVYGEYVIGPKRNEIILYYNNIPTLELYVHTFIHEYVHSTQDMDEYYRIHANDGIQNHPFESTADYLADLYTPIALQYLNLKDETRIQH